MNKSRHRARRWALAAVLACIALLTTERAHGQGLLENLFEAFGFGVRAEAEVVDVVIEAAPGLAADNEPFVAQIRPLLGTELHFVRKVCKPNDTQMDQLRRAGLVEVRRLAKQIAEAQRQNRHGSLPDARTAIARTMREKIDEVMPADAAKRYRDELAAREQARKQAAAEMMTTLVDRKVILLPRQFDEVTGAVLAKWDDAWARDLHLYLYEEFAPVPAPSVIKGTLSEQQQKLWVGGGRNGTIFFGWEHELGLDWVPQVGLGRDLLVSKSPPEAVEAPRPGAVELPTTPREAVR